MVLKNSEQKINSKKSDFLKKIVKKSIFPISTIALFAVTVCYWNNQNYGLALEYQGQTVVTMSNDKVYEQANHMIIDQLNSEDKSKIETSKSTLKITPVSKSECCESPVQIKDKIIEQSQEIINEGYGVYVNKKLVAVGNNENEINSLLQDVISETKSQNPDCEVEFADKVEVIKGLFSPEKIQKPEDVKNILKKGIVKSIDYTVTDEDTVVGIAERFGITPEKLLSDNDAEESDIAVGDKLKIKVTEKVFKLKVFKIITEENDIPYTSEETRDDSKEIPFKEVTQEGKNGKETFKYRVEYSNGQEVLREEIEHTIVEEPIAEKVTVGTKKPPKKSEFIWPVPFTKKITSPYGNREGGFHKGIDIACAGVVGTDIVASEGGKVIVASYGNTGYGNHVIIDHGNGKQTVYGHCQKLFVKNGQEVSQGEVIGTVGSTGDSTGPHLHFEIRINGQAKNPQQYV